MKIYLTHCSAKKNARLRTSGVSVTPDKLYTATPTRRFMERCKARSVEWAIFSDLYGVWFSHVVHKWYEKDPATVTEAEFRALVRNFDQSLSNYDEILFYRHPGRFHPMYRRVLNATRLGGKLTLFSHLSEIRGTGS